MDIEIGSLEWYKYITQLYTTYTVSGIDYNGKDNTEVYIVVAGVKYRMNLSQLQKYKID